MLCPNDFKSDLGETLECELTPHGQCPSVRIREDKGDGNGEAKVVRNVEKNIRSLSLS